MISYNLNAALLFCTLTCFLVLVLVLDYNILLFYYFCSLLLLLVLCCLHFVAYGSSSASGYWHFSLLTFSFQILQKFSKEILAMLVTLYVTCVKLCMGELTAE